MTFQTLISLKMHLHKISTILSWDVLLMHRMQLNSNLDITVYYNKTIRVWWAVWGDHWLCGVGRSPEPTGRSWSAPATNSVVYTYCTSDEGGFIFISYKREAYLNSPHHFAIICSFMCICKLIWLINNVKKMCCSGVVWHHSSHSTPIKCRGWKRVISNTEKVKQMCYLCNCSVDFCSANTDMIVSWN